MKAMMDRPHVIRTEERLADDTLLEPVPRTPHERVAVHWSLLLPALLAVVAVLWFFFGRH